jgi:hypothetical protein
MKRAFASSPKPVLILAGGVLIALATSIGWMTLRQPAGSSTRDTSFVAEIEEITDSLLHLLDGGNFGREEKNTAKSGVLQSSRQRRPARRETGLP